MKVLEIKTVNMGGEDIHTITHQEGWDFRDKIKLSGCVRWNVNPHIDDEGDYETIYLRGRTRYDTQHFTGGFDWDILTNFFNSEESPLNLKRNSNKKFIGDFDENDLKELNNANIGYYTFTQEDRDLKYVSNINQNGNIYHQFCRFEHPNPFFQTTKPELMEYLSEKYSFVRYKQDKVVMEYREITELGVKIVARTWKIV